MKNLMRVAEGVDVIPLLLAIKRRPELWKENTIRQDLPNSPHADTETILLRFNKIASLDEIIDDCEAFDFPAFAKLPDARAMIFGLMARVQGERLGRCMIVNLHAKGRVSPHADEGKSAAYYERFHIVLQSAQGNGFRVGDEAVWMRPGEVWWFNNAVEHEAVNDSDDDRIHLIVDIRTSGH